MPWAGKCARRGGFGRSRSGPSPEEVTRVTNTCLGAVIPLLLSSMSSAGSPLAEGDTTRVFDTTNFNGSEYYVNDHTFVQGDDGTWHLFGIFQDSASYYSAPETLFVHAVNPEPDPRRWQRDSFRLSPVDQGIALRVAPELGETHLWAPHVVKTDDHYVMVYQSGGTDNDAAAFRMATSLDLDHWQRVGSGPIFSDICVARDPMLARFNDVWLVYYTRCDDQESRKSGVAYRVSPDLETWSDPAMALVLQETPPMFNSGYTESPFVFERDGWFYLSVTEYPFAWNETVVYRSDSPFSFPDVPYARLVSHASEWIPSLDPTYLSHAGPGQGGVWMSTIHWPAVGATTHQNCTPVSM